MNLKFVFSIYVYCYKLILFTTVFGKFSQTNMTILFYSVERKYQKTNHIQCKLNYEYHNFCKPKSM